MGLPHEFWAMFDWMEVGGLFMASGAYPGDKLGLLVTEGDLHGHRITAILSRIVTLEQASEHAEAWFGDVVEGSGRFIAA